LSPGGNEDMDSDVKRWNNRIKNYGRKRASGSKKLSKFQRAHFIAWDGEGIQVASTSHPGEEEQVYALLANSEGDHIFDVAGLSTKACLDFLTDKKYPDNSTHVCFGASYDVNMFLRDLPTSTLVELHKGDKNGRHVVSYLDYELEYRPRKSFTVRRMQTEVRQGKLYKVYDNEKHAFRCEKSVTLWDVFGFFGKKFTKVIKEWMTGTEFEKEYTQDAIGHIQEFKERRGRFDSSVLQEGVLDYCLSECKALRDLCSLLHRYVSRANLTLRRWDGAGAAAASLLEKENVKAHIKDSKGNDLPPYEVVLASEFGYFGGWIENFLFGIIARKIFHYDLRSAYPSAMPSLPSLAMGHWEILHWNGQYWPLQDVLDRVVFPSFFLAHIRWKNGPTYGPGPFNFRHHTGHVVRPPLGQGWQWSPEILVAHRYKEMFRSEKTLDIQVDKIYYFVPDSDAAYPFTFVKDLYDLRRTLKSNGEAWEIIIKLALNSIYGKLAQSLGYSQSRGIKPPYHCLVYAGLITAITRAKLLEVALQAAEDIISIATDGIYSLSSLSVEEGENLGQWEAKVHDEMVIVQSGFYWIRDGDKWSHYYRGMNEDGLDVVDVKAAYQTYQEEPIPVPVTRFVTLGAAMGLNDFSKWRTWITTCRKLDINMQTSFKRKFCGEFLTKDIRITRCRFDDQSYLETLFSIHPELRESSKYEYDWDKERYDGQPAREVVEEMFHMELSPMD
jgi:hypothetical protein